VHPHFGVVGFKNPNGQDLSERCKRVAGAIMVIPSGVVINTECSWSNVDYLGNEIDASLTGWKSAPKLLLKNSFDANLKSLQVHSMVGEV
jgi:hypothetical protein